MFLFLLKSSIYIDFNVEKADEYPQTDVGDHVRTTKFKTILAKGFTPNWSKEVSCGWKR